MSIVIISNYGLVRCVVRSEGVGFLPVVGSPLLNRCVHWLRLRPSVVWVGSIVNLTPRWIRGGGSGALLPFTFDETLREGFETPL